MDFLILIVGFIMLIKGADILIDGSSSIAKKLGISNLMIGLTIVAFGTSAPEFFVNIIGSFRGQTDLAVGNILGSIIVNTLFVLGVSAIIYPLSARSSTVNKEVPFLLLGTIALFVSTNDILLGDANANMITRNEGILLMLFFIIFIVYTFGITKSSSKDDKNFDGIKDLDKTKSIFFIFFGLIGLIFGGYLLVESAQSIARSFGVSEAIIGLTIVAIGTSLPELAASAIAAYKKNADIAIGNVVGSNIYGIFLILGSSATTSNLAIGEWLLYDVSITVAATLILSLFLFFGGKKGVITRNEGIIMISLYLLYIIYLFVTQIA